MKNSLFILCILAGGIGCGRYLPLPHWMLDSQYSLYVLYLLMFTVGVSIGYDRKTLHTLFHQRLTVFAVPLATIVGTYCGVSLIAPLIDGRSWRECMAVGSGFGYYSYPAY